MQPTTSEMEPELPQAGSSGLMACSSKAETEESSSATPVPWCTSLPASVRVPAAVVPVPDRVGAAAACMVEATRGEA